jgi:transcription-repair coupling factor (superfamily II helicase)
MSDMSLFFNSMSGVLNQWSDFKVSRNLYKSYFDMQKTNAKESASEAASKFEKKETAKKTSSSAYSASTTDKLKTYANNVTSAVSNLESAFKTDEKTGEIDRDKAYEAANKFVDSFNELYSSTRKSGNSTVSNKSQFVANMTNAYTRKLENVGISVGSDGKLSIDKDTFNNADEKDLNEVFGKKDSYASFMSTQANAFSAYAQSAAYLDANSTYTKAGTVASSNASALSGVLYNQLF